MTVTWSPTAIADLEHLHSYIVEHDPTAAVRVAEAILSAVGRLAEFPALGRPGRVPGTRELVIPGTPFFAPYRVKTDRVEIIAVIHGAKKWPTE